MRRWKESRVLEALVEQRVVKEGSVVSTISLCQALGANTRPERLVIHRMLDVAKSKMSVDQDPVSLADSVRVCGRIDANVRGLCAFVDSTVGVDEPEDVVEEEATKEAKEEAEVCANCEHKYAAHDAVFCRRCGVKRGEGMFDWSGQNVEDRILAIMYAGRDRSEGRHQRMQETMKKLVARAQMLEAVRTMKQGVETKDLEI